MVICNYFRRYKRVFFLLVVMAVVTGLSTVSALAVLYQTAYERHQIDLVHMLQVKANLINAVGRFDALHSQNDHPNGAFAATLSQVIDANLKQGGFGDSGEFVLGHADNDHIAFLLPSRHFENQISAPIAMNSEQAAPMRMALAGQKGLIKGVDYRGVTVLAAYTPLDQSGFGLVAKIDLEEINQPFINAVVISFFIAIGLICTAVVLFHKATSPLIFKLESLVADRTKQLDKVNKELHYLSQHDALTGISNRHKFLQKLRMARSSSSYSVGLIFIDLDDFKPVNDQYGHPVGDTVLVQVAQRLRSLIRIDDCVARIGGDEFAIILTEIENVDDLSQIANAVIESLLKPVEITNERFIQVGCSVGAAMDDSSDESDTAFITRADAAMYKAKRAGGSSYITV